MPTRTKSINEGISKKTYVMIRKVDKPRGMFYDKAV